MSLRNLQWDCTFLSDTKPERFLETQGRMLQPEKTIVVSTQIPLSPFQVYSDPSTVASVFACSELQHSFGQKSFALVQGQASR